MLNPLRWLSPKAPKTEPVSVPPPPPPPSAFDHWFVDKQLTDDWTSVHFPMWAQALAGLECRHILEIGSFEGRSAIWFLNQFPNASLTCVDIFDRDFEDRFDLNMAGFGARVRKLKGRSTVKLAELIDAGDTYDLIYVDGWHHRDQCLLDGLLGWRMLRVGGVLIFDDYLWGVEQGIPIRLRPQDGINIFAHLYRSELTIMHVGWQVILRRIAGERR